MAKANDSMKIKVRDTIEKEIDLAEIKSFCSVSFRAYRQESSPSLLGFADITLKLPLGCEVKLKETVFKSKYDDGKPYIMFRKTSDGWCGQTKVTHKGENTYENPVESAISDSLKAVVTAMVVEEVEKVDMSKVTVVKKKSDSAATKSGSQKPSNDDLEKAAAVS